MSQDVTVPWHVAERSREHRALLSARTPLPRRMSGRAGRTSRSVSRILFPGTSRCSVRRPSISACRRRQAPAVHPQARAGSPRTPAQPYTYGLSTLLRVGFTEPPRSPGVLVVSYTTVSPLPPALRPVAVCSLWHCPAGRPGLPLTTTLPCGVRTFLGRTRRSRRGRPTDSSATTRILMPPRRPARPPPVPRDPGPRTAARRLVVLRGWPVARYRDRLVTVAECSLLTSRRTS